MQLGKTTLAEQCQIASKVTEIGRISVVTYVSDQFVVETAVDSLSGPEYKVGVLSGDKIKTTRRTMQKRRNLVAPPGE